MIPLGVLLFLRGTRATFWAVVISAPFFDTTVVEIPALTTAIRPSQYFAALFLLRRALSNRTKTRLWKIDRVELLAMLFLAIVIASSAMPLVLDRDIEVIPTDSSITVLHEIELDTLRFSRTSVTQLLYPVFYVATFLVLRRYIHDNDLAVPVMRALVWLSIAVLGSGIVYLALVLLNLETPLQMVYEWINGSRPLRIVRESGIGGTPLMYTIAGEPGYTGLYFLICLGPLAASVLNGNYGLLGNRRRTILLSVALVLSLLICCGTTGYVGLVIAGFFTYLFHTLYAGRDVRQFLGSHVRLVVIGLFSSVLILLAYDSYFGSSFLDYVRDVHLTKLQATSGSGVVRSFIAEHNLRTFLASPILGVGYGNDRGLAMGMFLLANTGILGFTGFAWFQGASLARAIRRMWTSYSPPTVRVVYLGVVIGLSTTLALLLFAKSESTLLFTYYWLLLAVAAVRLNA